METSTEFIKVAEPNMEELARLTARAKGPGRSLRQYAKVCGLCASTLSRIVNKKNAGASSDELIRKIAEHADPESGVTLDALMGANGMARILGPTKVYKVSGVETEEKFKDALLYELKYIDDLSYINESGFRIGKTLQGTMDFVLRSKKIMGDNSSWGFDIIRPRLPARDGQIGKDTDTVYALHMFGYQILDRIGRILPLFYGGSNKLGKMSFVIADIQCFDYIVSEFASYHVPFNMSFIKFNCSKQIIEQEFVLKQPDGSIPESILNSVQYKD